MEQIDRMKKLILVVLLLLVTGCAVYLLLIIMEGPTHIMATDLTAIRMMNIAAE
jgi:hypothetical protein